MNFTMSVLRRKLTSQTVKSYILNVLELKTLKKGRKNVFIHSFIHSVKGPEPHCEPHTIPHIANTAVALQQCKDQVRISTFLEFICQ